MTPLGKPLVFYLKYMAEMNRLYCEPTYFEGEKPDLTGLDNVEQLREMVRTVGDAAGRQVADFLELCGRGIEDHFTDLGIAKLTAKRTRALVLRHWSWKAMVQASSRPGGQFECGVLVTALPDVRISLPEDVCGVVVPWLWASGGRKGEDAMWKIVGRWADSRPGKGLVHDTGTIALSCIPIKAQPPESFDVDRDPLIAEVVQNIKRIGIEETKAIADFVAALKKIDES